MILESIVQTHADEAAWLWYLRTRAIDAPHYSLNQLANLDERVEAHIDGLRVAGEAGRPFCDAILADGTAGVFAAGVLAFESGDTKRIQEVVAVGTTKPKLGAGWLRHWGGSPTSVRRRTSAPADRGDVDQPPGRDHRDCGPP